MRNYQCCQKKRLNECREGGAQKSLTCVKGLSNGERERMHTQVRQALVARNSFDVPRNQNDLTYIHTYRVQKVMVTNSLRVRHAKVLVRNNSYHAGSYQDLHLDSLRQHSHTQVVIKDGRKLLECNRCSRSLV